jgi:hypothetical protein
MASKGIEDGAALPHDLYLLNTAQTLKDWAKYSASAIGLIFLAIARSLSEHRSRADRVARDF